MQILLEPFGWLLTSAFVVVLSTAALAQIDHGLSSRELHLFPRSSELRLTATSVVGATEQCLPLPWLVLKAGGSLDPLREGELDNEDASFCGQHDGRY